MTIKIETGIPIRAPAHGTLGGSIYPVKDMRVGDSIRVKASVRTYMQKLGRDHGFKMTTRNEGPDHVRVWRVE